MFWSQPKPWTKSMGGPSPCTWTLFRFRTDMAGSMDAAHYASAARTGNPAASRLASGPELRNRATDERRVFHGGLLQLEQHIAVVHVFGTAEQAFLPAE